MSKIAVITATLALALLAGCESMGEPSKEDIGMVTGAVLGGVIGHQVGGGSGQAVATVGGAALGGYIGKNVGRKMDREDHANATRALDRSSDGQSSTWRNGETGERHSITPTRTYRGETGGLCRDFTTVTEIDGHDDVVSGTACKQPDGTWKAH